ncbi:MAG: phytanoyl-CoA dioxygenase family protein [Opitutaceae bacterium]
MVADLHASPDQEIAEQAAFFAREGYVVARGLFKGEEVEEIRSMGARMHADGVPGCYDPRKEADGVKNPDDPLFQYPRIMMPHRFDDRAKHYMLLPRVADRLRLFFKDEPVAAQSMFYFKPPGARGQALHQDQFYLLVDPGTSIAAWTAIDDCDAENGAILVVPKTNDAAIVCPNVADARVSYTSHFVPVPEGLKPQLVPMKAGDTLFFNGSIIHGSGPNRSKTRFRRSFISHYVAGDTRRISGGYRPLLNFDGTEHAVEMQTSGGPCGEGWKGSLH